MCCDCLIENCVNKKCCKITRRIFEFIFLVIGTILLGLAINSLNYIGYFLFLSVYGPFFYVIYYFPRCWLDSDCLDKSYKCKRNTYFIIVLNGILFIIFIFVIVVWGIVNLIKVKKPEEQLDKDKEQYEADVLAYRNCLVMSIFGLIFVLFGISSIYLEIKIFIKEFLYFEEEEEKEKNKNDVENIDVVEVINVQNINK